MFSTKRHLFIYNICLGKPQKKSSTNGQAIKRGGGGKGRAIKEKKLFFNFFFILFPFKNEIFLH